jgi:DnaK suppressor protein
MAAKKKVPTKPAKARKPAAKATRPAAKPAKPAARTAAKKAAPRSAVAKHKVVAKPKAVKPAPKAHAKSSAAARNSAKPAPKSAAKAKKPAATKVAAAKPAAVELRKPAAPAQEFTGARAVAVAAKTRRFVAPAEDDEGGEEDRHNLLLGPRNVQPYIERKGEQYMGKEQLDHFRHILESWKQDLMEEVDRTMTHMKDEAANPPDPNDRATLESEFALELRTRDRERKLIRKIEEALKRIEDGSYGYCLETGEPIGIKRLEARPVATLCIEAQERRERREKQYGDRDDWYR